MKKKIKTNIIIEDIDGRDIHFSGSLTAKRLRILFYENHECLHIALLSLKQQKQIRDYLNEQIGNYTDEEMDELELKEEGKFRK